MKKEFTEELSILDLTDDELKELLGYTHEALKVIEESRKNDPELQRLKHVAKEYEGDNYTDEIKSYKARLKAARAQAKVRGIKYNPPEEMK